MKEERHPALLQRLMKEAGVSQADLSRATRANKQTINKLYKGKTAMSELWAKRIAPVLGRTWPELLGWQGINVGDVEPNELSKETPPVPSAQHRSDRSNSGKHLKTPDEFSDIEIAVSEVVGDAFLYLGPSAQVAILRAVGVDVSVVAKLVKARKARGARGAQKRAARDD